MTSRARQPRVAVLGAGMLGSCLALYLARRGAQVCLYDQERLPLCGASRWNEGKIHLGYLYGADPGLASARHLIPGGLEFRPLLEALLEESLEPWTTAGDDVFLIHRDSVTTPAQARAYYRRVSELVRAAPAAGDYLADARRAAAVELAPGELAAIADPAVVVAGFRLPERSVQTNRIADRLCAALSAEPRIEQRLSHRVSSATPRGSPDGPWQVRTEETADHFDYVVNALWQNRIVIDATAGLAPPAEWSSRYRLALFLRTSRALSIPSSVIAVGPFGDIKNYNGRDFYLSWYPAGLVHESDNTAPGAAFRATRADTAAVASATRAGLEGVLRDVGQVFDSADDLRVAGGWVFAQGRGSLADPAASLHRRDRFGVCRVGRYYSVDTGKYSLAPSLAAVLAEEIAGD